MTVMTEGSRLPRRLLIAGTFLLSVIVLVWLLQEGRGISLQLVIWQRDLHHALTQALAQLSATPSATTWSVLLGVSFGYGVFHAAGPGHGKAVLSTYLLTQGGAWRRALALSCAASLLQALTAITLVAVLVHGLGWLTRHTVGSVVWVEHASYLMVTLLGLWLCWRAGSRLRQQPSRPHADHAHDHHGGCECDHHISPSEAGDWPTALITIATIGIRPCSGGVILLGAASLMGYFWAGVLAVLVMAAGTALTVSSLALASVMARGWAERRLARQSRSSRARHLLDWAALGGGLVILALGVSLLLTGTGTTADVPLLESPSSHETAPGNPLLD